MIIKAKIMCDQEQRIEIDRGTIVVDTIVYKKLTDMWTNKKLGLSWEDYVLLAYSYLCHLKKVAKHKGKVVYHCEDYFLQDLDNFENFLDFNFY